MDRSKEYPFGRCEGCGWSGGSMDHNIHSYDANLLCTSCIARMNQDNPWCVVKVEKKTGDIWFRWRCRTREPAGARIARLSTNPDAVEGGRFYFMMFNSEQDFENVKDINQGNNATSAAMG